MIPESLIKVQSQTDDGQRWLDRLPVLIAEVCAQWMLRNVSPIDAGASCSWIARAGSRTGENVVVKIGLPHMEARDEAMALSLWQRQANGFAVRVHAHDEHRIAMLLESCVPGLPLKSQPEDQQDEIICNSLKQLWKFDSTEAVAHGIRDLRVMIEYWCEEARLRHADGRNAEKVEQGCEVFQDLLASTDEKCLLATDLHAGNILSAARRPWLLIDPKPFVGDPAYDLTQHALNCQARLLADPLALVQRLAALSGCSTARLERWLAARLLCDENLNDQNIEIANALLASTIP